ncbi:hypothetical protein ACIQCR_00220 [Streptomyces sp. NPDC093249]|uniref:hypothetical protein n=1 Tax=unclassified Streptomyces TaxID=2593676 RepID=UPI0038286676
MNAMHQYLFDAYRAAKLGEPAPPEPGTRDVAVLWELRDRRRFERVVAGRPARGGLRPRLRALLRSRAPLGECSRLP